MTMGLFQATAFFSLVLFIQCGEHLTKGKYSDQIVQFSPDVGSVSTDTTIIVKRRTKFCGGVPYTPGNTKCCDIQTFDARLAKCCQGVVRFKNYGRQTKCCGKSIINSWTKKCCRNNIRGKIFGRYTKCCGRNVYHSGRSICCNNRIIISSRTHFCCSSGRRACRKYGYRKCILRVKKVCGNSFYDPSPQICCDGRVTVKRYGDNTRCCGRAVYNIQTMKCCSGSPCAKKPQPKPRDLRNDTCLYPSPKEARRRMHYRCPHCQASSHEVDKADRLLKLSDAQQTRRHAQHAPWGLPKGGAGNGGCLLTQRYYITGYSTYLHVPLWVAYQLLGKNARKHRHRKDCFRRDIRLDDVQASNCSNYYHSGFDRGHLAPNADFSVNEEAELNTFLFSNMAPQTHHLNAGMWLAAERLTREWAKRYSAVYVISGSIFDEKNTGLRENDNDIDRWIKPDQPKTVAVPTHFYKIITRCNEAALTSSSRVNGCDGELDAIAFVLPHQIPTTCQSRDPMQYLLDHVVTIREIELLTRVTFFSALSQAEQNRIKSYAPTKLWPTQ